MRRRVVVTGMGCVTPLANQVDLLWERILAGKSGIHPLTIVDTTHQKVKFGGDCADFEPGDSVEAKEVKRLDRFVLFAMHAAKQAVLQSGIDFSKEDSYRCGAILGSGIGGLNEIEEQMFRLFSKGPDRVSPFTIPKMMLNAAGGNVGIAYGLRGPNFAVATACASSNNAMGDALKAIRYDEADVMVTGASEAAITAIGVAGFSNMKALSTRNDAPEKASRPFDADRDGFVLSEGCGVLVFEELEHAKTRGANILAEIIGYGGSCDAGHITAPDAEGRGASRAMLNALRDASVDASAVDYINAHGTSTPLGDKAETIAVKSVFGESARRVAISSTKGALGHALGASGSIELILSILACQKGVIPPTINLETPDPDCDLNYTPLVPGERAVNIAMSNSFGFGGHNATIICNRWNG
ncbi:MAG: beta-ketoacyl-ACP synthase II [Planctomycetota bacterium]|nr:beta-ketoacyl-ACP synthase II [Planctomycetota bacterium]